MPGLPFVVSILAAVAALAPTWTTAGENMLIDDFWMREKKSAPAPAPTRQAQPTRSKNVLIDDFWQRGKKPAQPAPAASGTASRPSATGTRAKPAELPAQPSPTRAAPPREELVPAVAGLPPDPGSSLTYRIGPSDLIRIEVFQVPELSSEERVSEDGNIMLPLVGAVTVGGLTPREAEARVAEILGRDYLQDPQVDIDVAQYANQQITVMGSVNKPGVFPITGATSLLQVIAMAEGMNALAKEDEVIVFRGDEKGGMMGYVVDVEAIQEGKLRDPILIGDDRVVVPESGTSAFIKGVADTLRGFVRIPGVAW